MASDLPAEFDVIVLGTGLPETLLAAAFSRIGLTVLHLDRNNYYSGSWASFNLHQIPTWVEDQQKSVCYVSDVDENKILTLVKEGETALHLPETFPAVYHPRSKYHVGERPKEVSESPSPSVDTAVGEETTEVKGDEKDVQAIDQSDTQPETVDTVAGVVPGQFDSAPEEGETETEGSQGQEIATEGGEVEVEKKKKREWFLEDVDKEWRRFSFDLSPKVLYCSGSMVELLIVSDVAKYCEFRTVSRVLTLRDSKLEKVPCSRADVFSSKALSLLEKRLLMKFLTFAADYKNQPDEFKDFSDKPFVEFLASKKLSPKIQHFILHSIAMATQSTPTEQGLASTQKFLRSLGRYGNTAFLFPLYGSGEIPQGFCRLSAVFGGIYVLTLSVSHLLVNAENKCTGIITTAGQRISCKYLIADPSYLMKEFYKVPESSDISRGIYVTDQSILHEEGEDLSLLQFPHEGQVTSPTTTVLELPPSSMVSPRGLYMVHMTRRSVSDVQSDLHPAISTLFGDNEAVQEETAESSKPKVLWSLCFQQRDLSSVSRTEQTPCNLYVVTGPGIELDTDRCVDEAKNIFKEICPEEEFLPKPPHPDDIIYVDTEEVSAAGNEQGDWAADSSTPTPAVPTDPDTNTDTAKQATTDKDAVQGQVTEGERTQECRGERDGGTTGVQDGSEEGKGSQQVLEQEERDTGSKAES